jgi:hypothetical protein
MGRCTTTRIDGRHNLAALWTSVGNQAGGRSGLIYNSNDDIRNLQMIYLHCLTESNREQTAAFLAMSHRLSQASVLELEI